MNSWSCGSLDKSFCIRGYQGSPTAGDDYDAAIAAAEAAYGLGLADANLAWTTAVVGAETTFLSDEATGRKDLAVAAAGFDKTTAEARRRRTEFTSRSAESRRETHSCRPSRTMERGRLAEAPVRRARAASAQKRSPPSVNAWRA